MDNLKNIYCKGSQVSFRHPIVEDIDHGWYEWLSDEETTRYLGDRVWPNCIENQHKFYESLLNQDKRLVLSIVHNEDDKLIGICNLSNINWVHRYCDIAVIIGEKDYRRGAIAIEVYDMLFKIAFTRLNLKTLLSFSCSSNETVNQLHYLVGFECNGTIPNLYQFGDQSSDFVMKSITSEKWLQIQEK